MPTTTYHRADDHRMRGLVREVGAPGLFRHLGVPRSRLEPQTACQVLVEAGRHLTAGSDVTTVVADSGIENVNEEVDSLLGDGQFRRVLAQVEIAFSDSVIEASRSLKHGWLYLHQLNTFASLEKLVAFHVGQHNTVVPHLVFAGQTPDAEYFDQGEHWNSQSLHISMPQTRAMPGRLPVVAKRS